MLEARPDRPFWGRPWVESAFTAHLPGYPGGPQHDSHRLDGWSVGGCIGAETLVQSRPMARASDDPVDDLLRAQSRCSMGVFHASATDAPPCPEPPRTARFKRWMGVFAGPSLPEESRSEILQGLPAFLARDAVRAPDTQLHLLALLHHLYTATGYQNAYAEPHALAEAMAEFARTRGDLAPASMFVSDGRTLGVLLREGCLLSSRPPPAIRPATRLVASRPDFLPASLWLWKPEAPPSPPRDAERLSPGIFTVHAGEPGVLERL